MEQVINMNTAVLTESQEVVISNVLNAVRQGHKRIILKGSAGVGKTFTMNEFIKRIRKENIFPYGRICVTAPTHKALSVLREKVLDSSVELSTIFSALRLRRTFVGRKEYYNESYTTSTCLQNVKLLIIDESSMLSKGDDKMKGILWFLDKYYPELVILFVGDEKQINPVNEINSPIFHRDYLEFELTEIVRQAGYNPIIYLSRNLHLINSKVNNVIGDSGYVYSYNKSKIVSKLAEANGTDELKYLAWTNVVVNGINSKVRQEIYGTPLKIENGETLIINKPFGGYYNNQEISIRNVEIINQDFIIPTEKSVIKNREGSLKVVNGEFDSLSLKVYFCNGELPILHEESELIYKRTLQSIKNKYNQKSLPWVAKVLFEEQFVDFKYNHAITVHKSQGSTYETSIIDVKNINNNPSSKERRRLLYTAVTRASQMNVLFNV